MASLAYFWQYFGFFGPFLTAFEIVFFLLFYCDLKISSVLKIFWIILNLFRSKLVSHFFDNFDFFGNLDLDFLAVFELFCNSP